MKPSQNMFDLLKEDHARRWSRPLSWWNLFVLWPIPFLLAYSFYTQQIDLQIAKRQQTTVATINAHDPPNHDRYGYIFPVSGRTFTGWAYPNDKRDFSMGEQVIVYYDPSDPTRNSASDFYSVSTRDLFFVPFCLLAMVAMPLVIFFQRRARLRATEKPLATQ